MLKILRKYRAFECKKRNASKKLKLTIYYEVIPIQYT